MIGRYTLYLYLDPKGIYRTRWGGDILTLTEQQLAAILALDAGAAGQALNRDAGDFIIEGVGKRWVAELWEVGEYVYMWCYDLIGIHEGEGE